MTDYEPRWKDEPIELSPFNVNHDFKDEALIETLKTAITKGAKLPIWCYRDSNVLQTLEGGHTLEAYVRLATQPRLVYMIQDDLPTDADKIAWSRKKNHDRLQRRPVSNAKALAKEMMLRTSLTTIDALKKLLRRIRYAADRGTELAEEDSKLEICISNILATSGLKLSSFSQQHMQYVDFSKWLATYVDSHQLGASHALEVWKFMASDSYTDAIKATILTHVEHIINSEMPVRKIAAYFEKEAGGHTSVELSAGEKLCKMFKGPWHALGKLDDKICEENLDIGILSDIEADSCMRYVSQVENFCQRLKQTFKARGLYKSKSIKTKPSANDIEAHLAAIEDGSQELLDEEP